MRSVGEPAPADGGARAGLVEYLTGLADPAGFIRFDRFMEAALYAEAVGYYTQPRSPLGPGGDFYTAPSVSPLFAACLAERVRQLWARNPEGRPFTLLELGPGDGSLAAAIVRDLSEGTRPLDGLRIVLVERSEPLRATAFRAVRDVAGPLGAAVRPAETVGEIGPFEGVVLANELLDAQPARRLRWNGSAWLELGVRVGGGVIVPGETDRVADISGPPLPEGLDAGTIFEFSPLAESLVREVADHLVRGSAVFVDYGMEQSELVHGHPQGTLAAVRGHRDRPDPLVAAGRTDLSTFVNWTRLRHVAAKAGLVVEHDRSQAEALTAWGLPARLDQALAATTTAEAQVRLRLAAKNLVFGFERFRVLELSPQAAGPPAR